MRPCCVTHAAAWSQLLGIDQHHAVQGMREQQNCGKRSAGAQFHRFEITEWRLRRLLGWIFAPSYQII